MSISHQVSLYNVARMISDIYHGLAMLSKFFVLVGNMFFYYIVYVK